MPVSGDTGALMRSSPQVISALSDHAAEMAQALRVIKRVLGKEPRPGASDLYKLSFIEKWYELAADYSANLKLIRPYTGKNFSTAKGYTARKITSARRAKTVAKYANAVQDLTSRDHVVFVPTRQEKTEAFEYSGQTGLRQFTKAIIHRPSPGASYNFEIDQERPTGSKFVAVNKRTGERSWHIPDDPFWDVPIEQDEYSENVDPQYIEDVLREYADDGDTFMIHAGDFHMWGSAGSLDRVAVKVSELFTNYGDKNFDPYNKNSHNIRNWFRGVTVYSRAEEVTPYILDQAEKRAKANEEKALPNHGVTIRLRLMVGGWVGLFLNGNLFMRLNIFSLPQTFRVEGYVYRVELAKGNRMRVMYGDQMVASVYMDSGQDTA